MAGDNENKVFSIFKTKNTHSPKETKPEKVLNSTSNKKKLLDKKIEPPVVSKSKTASNKNAPTSSKNSVSAKYEPKFNAKSIDLFDKEVGSSSDEEEPKIDECVFVEKNAKKPVKKVDHNKQKENIATKDEKLKESLKTQTLEDLRYKSIDSGRMHVSKALEYMTKLKSEKRSENDLSNEKPLDLDNRENISNKFDRKNEKLKESLKTQTLEDLRYKSIDSGRQHVSKVLEYMNKLKSEKKSESEPVKEKQLLEDYITKSKLKSEKKLQEDEEEVPSEQLFDSNKNDDKIVNFSGKLHSEKTKKDVSVEFKASQSIIVLESDTDSSQSQKKTEKISPKRKEVEVEVEEDDEDDENSSKRKFNKPKREYEYEVIDENIKLDEQIEKLGSINKLTEAQIEYMVLRDINYYIDIFSGNCDHSWRHLEFKKFSKKSGNLLYSNAALSSFRSEQYTAACKALQSIFCRKNNKFDEYIVKVLLPEALIKICMRIYQCSKDSAEEFLQRNNFKNDFKEIPRGAVIK